MRRLLITGAGGFVGHHCQRPALAAGFDVHAVHRTPAAEAPVNVAFHRLDLFDPLSTDRVLAEIRPTHLLHLAWVTTPGVYWTSPLNNDWVAASIHLLERFHYHGGRRVVMIGTCAEYDWSEGSCVEHETPLRPSTRYGRAKAELHEAVAAFADTRELSYAWARLFFLYGHGEDTQRLLPSVIRALLKGEPAPISEGAHRRDYLHVADAAEALVQLVASDVEGPVNIASGEAVAIRDIALRVGRILSLEHMVKVGAKQSSRDEAPLVVASVRRLNDEVGFRPRRSLGPGLEETIQWWRTQTGKDDA